MKRAMISSIGSHATYSCADTSAIPPTRVEGFRRSTVGGWIHRLVVAISQLINTIFGGMPDETVSSRVYREKYSTGGSFYCFLELAINSFFFWEIDHCFLAWSDEVNRRHVHPEMINSQNRNKH